MTTKVEDAEIVEAVRQMFRGPVVVPVSIYQLDPDVLIYEAVRQMFFPDATNTNERTEP